MQEIPLDGESGLQLLVAALSDVGSVRKNNEDSVGVFPGEDPARGSLFVVADGMGGAAAGEVASRLAVETVRRHYFASAEGTPAGALREALESANSAIFTAAVDDPDKGGMGTTCTAVAVSGDELWFGHVGDSRAYLQTGAELRQVTRDHSLAAELERQGGGAELQAARVKNVLTRCLGAESTVKVDVPDSPLRIQDGMTLVLCSDGLTNLVEDGEILHQIAMHLPEGACRRLVDLAKERGAPDNVTVVVARVIRA